MNSQNYYILDKPGPRKKVSQLKIKRQKKTFKAIIMSHPFILVSIPKSLEVLKELGYKTFSPWIDESYDQEMDDNKRMMMIVNEIERLCNLSQEDLEKFLVAMKEVCSYNHNVLRNKKTFIYKL